MTAPHHLFRIGLGAETLPNGQKIIYQRIEQQGLMTAQKGNPALYRLEITQPGSLLSRLFSGQISAAAARAVLRIGLSDGVLELSEEASRALDERIDKLIPPPAEEQPS